MRQLSNGFYVEAVPTGEAGVARPWLEPLRLRFRLRAAQCPLTSVSFSLWTMTRFAPRLVQALERAERCRALRRACWQSVTWCPPVPRCPGFLFGPLLLRDSLPFSKCSTRTSSHIWGTGPGAATSLFWIISDPAPPRPHAGPALPPLMRSPPLPGAPPTVPAACL